MMVDRINDILWQAQQGSVAAIIQVLNQKLSDSGVRTRAMFADGVLQLLCEARTEDMLEKSSLVNTIRQIIEQIAPKNIYKININSRIVREQQLLWLEEIHRDPENQVLWSEEITLEKPNPLQQFIKDLKERKAESKNSLPKTQAPQSIITYNKNKSKNSAWGWFFLGVSICMCFGITGFALFTLFGNRLQVPIRGSDSSTIVPVNKSVELQNPNNLKKETTQLTSNPSNSISADDPFADAVRIANETTKNGKKARNSTQWLELAASWQRASDLMNKVPRSHSRYQEAQIRTQLYREYSEAAQKQADKSKL
jgi:hypothetical protein